MLMIITKFGPVAGNVFDSIKKSIGDLWDSFLDVIKSILLVPLAIVAIIIIIAIIFGILVIIDERKKKRKYQNSLYFKETGTTWDQMHSGTVEDAGSEAEYQLSEFIQNRYGKKAEYFISAIFEKSSKDDTTEIDMLAVTHSGLLIFECKNYSGILTGDLSRNGKWIKTKLSKNGNVIESEEIESPIFQNYKHKATLKGKLQFDNKMDHFFLHSIIVLKSFPEGSKFTGKIDSNTYVASLDGTYGEGCEPLKKVLDRIDKQVSSFSDEDIKMLSDRIRNNSRHGKEAIEQHIKNMKARHSNQQ